MISFLELVFHSPFEYCSNTLFVMNLFRYTVLVSTFYFWTCLASWFHCLMQLNLLLNGSAMVMVRMFLFLFYHVLFHKFCFASLSDALCSCIHASVETALLEASVFCYIHSCCVHQLWECVFHVFMFFSFNLLRGATFAAVLSLIKMIIEYKTANRLWFTGLPIMCLCAFECLCEHLTACWVVNWLSLCACAWEQFLMVSVCSSWIQMNAFVNQELFASPIPVPPRQRCRPSFHRRVPRGLCTNFSSANM